MSRVAFKGFSRLAVLLREPDVYRRFVQMSVCVCVCVGGGGGGGRADVNDGKRNVNFVMP